MPVDSFLSAVSRDLIRHRGSCHGFQLDWLMTASSQQGTRVLSSQAMNIALDATALTIMIYPVQAGKDIFRQRISS